MSELTLPFELLTNIFERVDEQDVKCCLLVCRSWRHAALSLLCYDSLSIKLTDDRLDLLAKDLEDYPSIGDKLSCITITESSSNSASSTHFMAVVNACSGPLDLHLHTRDIYRYLVMLYCSKLVVPYVQMVCLCGFVKKSLYDIGNSDEYLSPNTMELYSNVNFRFRTSITSIRIMPDNENYSLEGYGGLIKYVARFPMLQCLKATSINYQDYNIDLSELLSRSPQLTSLELKGFNVFFTAPTFLDEHEYPGLTSLTLVSESINTNLLEHMMSRLKNLQIIQLMIDVILPCQALTKSEEEHRLKKFKEYAKSIQHHHICYSYELQEICEDNINTVDNLGCCTAHMYISHLMDPVDYSDFYDIDSDNDFDYYDFYDSE